MTQRTILIPKKAGVSQRNVTPLASKTLRMPIGSHRFDDTTNNEIIALVAARREQDVEVFLAILSTFEFVEDTILELSEALGTPANQ